MPTLKANSGYEAGEELHERTWGRQLVAELLPADDDGVPIILYDAAEVDDAAASGMFRAQQLFRVVFI